MKAAQIQYPLRFVSSHSIFLFFACEDFIFVGKKKTKKEKEERIINSFFELT